jgi:hypothetical protein
MTSVFKDAVSAGAVFTQEQLQRMKSIFDELCEELKLSSDQQSKRDALARVLLSVGQDTTDEAQLRSAALNAINNK